MADESKAPVCAVVGVGPGNGEAFARRFSADGYAVALLGARTELSAQLADELPRAKAYACDVADATSVAEAFARIRADLGEVDVLVFNAGSGVWGTDRGGLAGGFRARLAGQHAWPLSRRAAGDPGDAPARAGARSSSSARRPRGAASPARRPSRRPRWRSGGLPNRWRAISGRPGIHVALIIVVDGVVGGPVNALAFPDRPEDAFIAPAGVADIAAAWSGRTAPPGASRSRRGPTRRSGEGEAGFGGASRPRAAPAVPRSVRISKSGAPGSARGRWP